MATEITYSNNTVENAIAESERGFASEEAAMLDPDKNVILDSEDRVLGWRAICPECNAELHSDDLVVVDALDGLCNGCENCRDIDDIEDYEVLQTADEALFD